MAAVMNAMNQAAAFGTGTTENGAQMYGQCPHNGPEAWFHTLFPGLDEPAIADLQSTLRRPIPAPYREFLRVTNGLYLFSGSLSLYGRRRDYSRKLSIWLPFDLATPNVKERPRAADPTWFIFAFYQADGSTGYLDPIDNRVYRASRDMAQPRLNQWANLDAFLQDEVKRLTAHFDDRGRRLDRLRPTTPDAASEAALN
jgi:hypothetical protein